VEVRAHRGRVRAYGVVLETDGPGVVWDTLSMIGAFTPRLLELDEAHFAEQLERRRSNLVILGYGGNDLRRYVGRGVTAEELESETRAVLDRVRRARPEAGCLLTGVIEHERSGQTDVRPEHVEAVVEAQRRAARAAGCAFFDLYRAMGGAGSFAEWRRRGLAADDQKHLSPRGRRVVADWMYEALVAGYVEWRTSRS
jgi:lysophospholipase L1-like esterase